MTDDNRRNIAEMGDAEFRCYLRELYRQADQMAAEHEAYMAERKALASPPVSETVIHRNGGDDALETAPMAEPEPWAFTEEQFEALADVINTLRRDWERDIERIEQRILNTVVKLVMPGEVAEQEVYALKSRVALAEQRIERQLSEIVERRLKEAITDNVLDLPAGFWKRDAA